MKLLKNIFLFLFVTILLSCSNVFENLNETDFIVSLDLSELVNNQNKTQARNASENVGKLTLTLYNALDNSIEQAKEAISKEVLPVVSSVAVDINTEGTTKVSFLKIPIGINAVIFAECSIPNADNSNVLYEGYSQVFEVTNGKNSVKIDLSKIVTEANPEDNVTEDNEKTDEENTDEENTDEEGDQVTEDTKDPEPTPEPEPEEGDESNKKNYHIEISFPEYSDCIRLEQIQNSNKVEVVVNKEKISIFSYTWFVDGVLKSEGTNKFDFFDEGYDFNLGQYTVMVVCKANDGKTYSATMQVTVQNYMS